MVSPAAMFIEAGAARMKDVPKWFADLQRKELHSFGDVRARQIGASGVSEDFRIGYELGLATLRVLVSGNPAAVQAGVDL